MSNLTHNTQSMIDSPKIFSTRQFYWLFFIGLFWSVSSCKNPPQQNTSEKSLSFGENIDTSGMITFKDIVAKMENIDSLDAKVFGRVEAVCQTKGCWMDIVSHDGISTEKELFVQFKDYGFFMPKDLAGKLVVVDGYAYRETTSVEDLKHYAEDEGLSQEEIDAIVEPSVEVKFMASGVKVLE